VVSMARSYAGVIGLLAFTVVIARNMLHDGSMTSSVQQALVCMVVYALIGGVVGRVAQFIVDDLVRSELAEAMKESARLGKTKSGTVQ